MTLNKSETKRYSRQILLPEVGQAGQERLKSSRVICIGAGGLGCPALTYLAASGVGEITIVDGDDISFSNLHRQILFIESEEGENKALVAARKLQAQNPHIVCKAVNQNLDTENVRSLLTGCDLVLDGSDNFATRYLVNDACVELGIPFISASIFRFEGQVGVFNAPTSDGKITASYRCLFPEPPSLAERPPCSEAGVLPVVPGVLGVLQANEALSFLLTGHVSTKEMFFTFDLSTHTFHSCALSRDEEQCKNTRILSQGEYEALMHQECECHGGLMAVREREAEEVISLAEQDKVYLIDVRESFERDAFHIGGKHIPLGFLDREIESIPRDKEVVFYCHSGIRSYQAIQFLQQEYGLTNATNMRGGVAALKKYPG